MVMRMYYGFTKKDEPELKATIWLPLILCLNFSMLLSITGSFKMIDRYQIADYWIVILYLILILGNYFLFIRTKRYKSFIEEFEQEPKKQRRINFLIGLFIGIGCLFLPTLIFILNSEPIGVRK